MVLSNYKCMHIRIHIRIQNSRILIQTILRLTSLFQYSTVHSSNRKVILLILQLETDYFSSYSFQRIRSSDITVFTETSRNCILHEEVQGILQILHSTFGYPYRTPSRRQRALHPVQIPILHIEGKEIFKYIHSSYKTFQIFQIFQHSRHSSHS